MRFAPDKCDRCDNYVNKGPNWVPYGDTWVNEGDCWECRLGFQNPEECQEDMSGLARDEYEGLRIRRNL